MNPKEKFDIIINEIERLVLGEKDQDGDITYYENLEISDKAFDIAQCFVAKRDRDAIFQFLIGKTVSKYIAERKMMAIYRYILEDGEINNEKGISLTGVSGESQFIRAFGKRFFVNPTEAVALQDFSLLLPAAYWDNVTEHDRICLEAEASMRHYKLNQRECELAYEIYRANSYDLEEVFEYVYSYVCQFIEGEQEADERGRDIEFHLRKKEVQKMYFEYHFTMDAIFGVLVAQKVKMIRRRFEECDKMYLAGAAFIIFDAIEDKWGEIFEQKGKVTPYDENQAFFSFYDDNYEYYVKKVGPECTYFDYLHYAFLSLYADKEVVLAGMKKGIENYKQLLEEIAKEKRRIIVIDNHRNPEDDYMLYLKEEEQRKRDMLEELGKKELYGEVGAEDWEDYMLSSLEQDRYNPDFDEEGYQVNYESEEYDCDGYEPDLDDPEWLEEQYMSNEVGELSYLYLDAVSAEDQIELTNMPFEDLCVEVSKAMKIESERKKLHQHSSFDVKGYLDKKVEEWKGKGRPYYTKHINIDVCVPDSEDDDGPFGVNGYTGYIMDKR